MTETKQTVPWDELVARRGRNEMPGLLVRHFHELTHEDRIKALHTSWFMAEWPEVLVPSSFWTFAFITVGYMEDGVSKPSGDPSEIVTLYRGAILGNARRLSWTDDRDTAVWFANRFKEMGGDRAYIYKINVPRKYILAKITSRGENEYVTDVYSWASYENNVQMEGAQ